MGKHCSLYWATFYSLMHGTKFKIPLELTRVIYKFSLVSLLFICAIDPYFILNFNFFYYSILILYINNVLGGSAH